MMRRGPALLFLTIGLAACGGEQRAAAGGDAHQSGAPGSGSVPAGGTGGVSPSASSAGGLVAPTGGGGNAVTGGGESSPGVGGTSSVPVESTGGAAAVASSAGGSTGGQPRSEVGGAATSGAAGDDLGGAGPSRAGQAGDPSTRGAPLGGAGGTGAVSPSGGAPAAGSAGVPASRGGSGAGQSGGSSGASGSAQGGPSVGAEGGALGGPPTGISWPIDCIPGDTCTGLGLPDIDGDGFAYDCGPAGIVGHQGTDIAISWEQMDVGVNVRAAADGEVFFAADGKYDRCPNATEPDCQRPGELQPGASIGTDVCTELGPYCGTGMGSCFWCFAGGNVIVILHEGVSGVFATRYDHLKNGSVLVSPGEHVARGEVIAEVGSAGNSTEPHLHFEVWGTGYYELADPWAGACGPNMGPSLWANEPPWE